MTVFAEMENFEKALEMREYLKIVRKLKDKVVANMPQDVSYDAFAYVTDEEAGAVCAITIRSGKILGAQNFSVTDGAITSGETMQNFLLEYYKNKPIPDEILVNIEIENKEALMEYFSSLKGKKACIIEPKIAVKKNVITMAEENAREHLFKRVREDKLKFKRTIGALINLKNVLKLEKIPKRMECFDISNISGTNSVSSMVVFVNGEPARKMYRKFKIKTVQGPNDYASHIETLNRRLNELQKAEDDSFSSCPDLIVIDGGKGQLSSAVEVLKERKLNIPIIGLAEKFEEVFLPNNSMPLLLKRSSEELKLLQRIRDEAHRFAINYHRNLRNKAQISDPLDQIFGIGKQKRMALYNQFKTLDNIKHASVDELMLVKGIHKELAETIYKFFNK